MRKVFLDTNVVIDFLGERKDFFSDAAQIICQADKGDIEIMCSSLTYSNTAYILHHVYTVDEIKNKLRLFSQLCEITTVDKDIIQKAIDSKYNDIEDALQYFSATKAGADVIVTRNVKDFVESNIPIMTPKEFLTAS